MPPIRVGQVPGLAEISTEEIIQTQLGSNSRPETHNASGSPTSQSLHGVEPRVKMAATPLGRLSGLYWDNQSPPLTGGGKVR